MKRWTTGPTASFLIAALLLGGCAGTPACSGGVSSDETSLTTGASTAAISSSVTETSGAADVQSAYTIFLKNFYSKDPSENTNAFWFRYFSFMKTRRLVSLIKERISTRFVNRSQQNGMHIK